MLSISNLKVCAGEHVILSGLNLELAEGSAMALMGPNGSGKSTLARVLIGDATFEVHEGALTYRGQSLLALAPEERAALGIFLSFQDPPMLPGVSNATFLRTLYNAHRKAQGHPPCDPMDFLSTIKALLPRVGLDLDMMYRSVNEGFSGGEKKRNEMLQMLLLKPKCVIVDEVDSGLDIDALELLIEVLYELKASGSTLLMITHHPTLLKKFPVDRVSVLSQGRLVYSGGSEILSILAEKGYAGIPEASGEMVP